MRTRFKFWDHSQPLEENGLRGFYLFVLISLFSYWKDLEKLVPRRQAGSMDPVWSWELFESLAPSSSLTIYLLFYFNLLIFLTLGIKPQLTALRFFGFAGFFFFHSFLNSFGKIDHSEHTWILALAALCLPWKKLSLGLALAQITAFFVYVSSGLWKLRRLLEHAFGSHPGSLSRTLPEHMAYAYAEGSLHFTGLLEFLYYSPLLSSAAWVGVIVVQLSFAYPILTGRGLRAFALLAIMFHTATLMTLGISFKSQCFLLIWLFFVLKVKTGEKPQKFNNRSWAEAPST